jgi:calmodulin
MKEFDQILKTLGQTMREDELQEIVGEIDRDGNGLIDFTEFLELVAPKIIANRSERAYLEAFKIVDDSDDGLINLEELMRANIISQAGLTETQLRQIVDYVDKQFGGKLNFTHALKMLYRTLPS